MTPRVTTGTRLVALLGDPVAHSLSPTFQNAALRAAGFDAVYLALRCAPDTFAGLLRGIAAAGGAGNVTIPHKQRAAEVVDRLAPDAERTAACNTYWFHDGLVFGDNTDVVGVRQAVRRLLGRTPRECRVLLLGAGGAARAAVVALCADGIRELVLYNRTPEQARRLGSEFAGALPSLQFAESLADLRGVDVDLIVNATSLGLHEGDPLPLDLERVQVATRAALDLVYTPAETRWVRALRNAGVPAADGLEMLLHQGAASFERWWGIPAPVEAMRAALPRRDAFGSRCLVPSAP